MLPALPRALGWETRESLGPEEFGEARSIHALACFLDALGSAERPALIILDDCQWADGLTIKLITHWSRQVSSAASKGRHVTLVAAFRTEEVKEHDSLRRVNASEHLRLPPLQGDDLRRLLESMAGPLPAEAIELVRRLSDGSPFMASAVLQGMVECGALVAEQEGWCVEPSAMAALQSSSHAGALLSRRLDLLPERTINLLTAAAILGKEFDLDVARRLTDQCVADATAGLDEARRRRLVWVRPDGTHCAFVHDRIRVNAARTPCYGRAPTIASSCGRTSSEDLSGPSL